MTKEKAIKLFKDCLKKIEQEDLTDVYAERELLELDLPDAYDLAIAYRPDENKPDMHYIPISYSLTYKGKTIYSQTLSVCTHLYRDDRFTRSGKEAVNDLINKSFKTK